MALCLLRVKWTGIGGRDREAPRSLGSASQCTEQEPTLCVGKALTSKLTGVEGRKQTLAVTFPLLFRMSSQSQSGRGCPEEERRAGLQTEVRGISFP